MIPHDFMTMHAAKMVEYLIAVSYLLLFIPFWRFVNAKPVAEDVALPATHPVASRHWFSVPDGLFYHPGHAWLRVEGPETVAIGFDDFAGKLVGAPAGITLPPVGATLVQGEPGWALVADGRSIDMLSPVDGVVVAVNHAAAAAPALAHERPYAEGWLLKVRSAALASNLKQLLSGRLARRWIDDLAESLRNDLTPALGQVYQDGGAVVDGLARVLEPNAWDQVARRYLLTESQGGRHA
jgi:glycine cleavage system H lipoate-binding protein